MRRFFFFFVLLSSFSFNVFADTPFTYVGGCIDCTDRDFFIGIKNKSASTIDILKQDIIDMGCFATKHSSGAVRATIFSGDIMKYSYCDGSGVSSKRIRFVSVTCPSGQELVDGVCTDPEPKYCDRPDIISQIESARMNCESGGGIFNYSCSDEEQTWESTCDNDDGSCSDVEGEKGQVRWASNVWGEPPPSGYLCSYKGGGCVAAISQDTSLCFPESGWCYGDYIVIGPSCDVPNGPSFCSDPNCNAFRPEPDRPPTDPDNPDPETPDHEPDDPTGGDIEDPNVLPDSDSDVIVPDNPDDKPDVEDPEITPETDKAVVAAVTGMNKDVNSSLHALNTDVNKGVAAIQNDLRVLNSSLVTNTQAIQKQQINDNEIYRKTKSLIQQANADITSAVNRNTGAVNSLGEELGGLSGTLTGIGEDIEGISETLDGIANTDTTGAGWGGTCIADDSCTGFYDSGYPDGIEGVVSGHMSDIKDSVLDGFINTFGDLDLSNAKAPSFCMNVITFGEYCFTDYIDFDWLFGFVRFCMIFTAIAQARRIIFGG